jgi:hypothetical protein
MKTLWQKTARFDVPYELSCLREGEKLLIQQISCYVPTTSSKWTDWM